MLRIAASLGGDVPVRLGRVLGGFDATNIARITDAITVANGGQPHRCRADSRRSTVDMDMLGMDSPTVRIWPIRERGLSPALMWDDLVGLATTQGGVLVCPWCGLCSNLHLAGIYCAIPSCDWDSPSFGVDVDVMAAMVVVPGVEAAQQHGGANEGVMLAVECWCENGCRGRSSVSTRTRRVWTWWC